MRKNLLILHLESIAWQTLQGFPEAFPNLQQFMRDARTFRTHLASATSTQMVMTALLHGNDFEFDAQTSLGRPAANNPSLMTLLRDAGYRAEMLCLTASENKLMMPPLRASTGYIRATSDRDELLAHFDAALTGQPFALYVWNLATHIEHATATLAATADLTDLLGATYLAADRLLGEMLARLTAKGLLDDTVIIAVGDHGDDFWGHGFKNGLTHGTEPYTQLIHTPLAIRAAGLPPGEDRRIVSTIDLAPTCLDLLGIDARLDFPRSGFSLLAGTERRYAFSQNFAAAQPDIEEWDVRRAFSISDRSWTLMVSSRGLALFNPRIDPTSQCNLLHFFDLDAGHLQLCRSDRFNHMHFAATMRAILADPTLDTTFQTLREQLRTHVAAKNDYVLERTGSTATCLDLACFASLDRDGRDRFLNGRFETDPAPSEAPAAPADEPPQPLRTGHASRLIAWVTRAIVRAR